MLLETLLLSPCFLTGKTNIKDSKTNFPISRNSIKEDETLLFFDIDDKSNPDCKLREFFWGENEGHLLCDLLVFFAKGSKRVFCFVELKDNKSDFPKATDQVISTYKAFKEKRTFKCTAKAFIYCSAGELPQDYRRYQKNLEATFGNNSEHDGKPENFLNFLRGENVKFNKRGQKKK